MSTATLSPTASARVATVTLSCKALSDTRLDKQFKQEAAQLILKPTSFRQVPAVGAWLESVGLRAGEISLVFPTASSARPWLPRLNACCGNNAHGWPHSPHNTGR